MGTVLGAHTSANALEIAFWFFYRGWAECVVRLPGFDGVSVDASAGTAKEGST